MGVTRVRRTTKYRPEIDGIGWNGSSKCFTYRCPKCKTSFRILGRQEKYCHGCGRKLDWEGLPQSIDTDLLQKLIKACNDETIAEVKYIELANALYNPRIGSESSNSSE